jgi:hypothetical protein
MKRFLLMSVAVAGLVAASSLSATAQTGPIKGTGKDTGPVGGGGGAKMTPDRLMTYLQQKMSAKAEIRKLANGAQTVFASIEKDGWRYELEFEYTLDGNTFNVVSPLGGATQTISGAQGLALLKKSYDINPYHFSYRPSDQRICLENPLWGTQNMTDQLLQNIVDGHLQTIRNTYSVWNPDNFKGMP